MTMFSLSQTGSYLPNMLVHVLVEALVTATFSSVNVRSTSMRNHGQLHELYFG